MATAKDINYLVLQITTRYYRTILQLSTDQFCFGCSSNECHLYASLTFHGINSGVISLVAYKFSTIPWDYWGFAQRRLVL
jgi:hypothetical protein